MCVDFVSATLLKVIEKYVHLMSGVYKILRLGLLPLGMGMLLLMHLVVARTLSSSDFGLFSLLITSSSIAGLLLCAGIPLTAQKYVSAYISVNDFDSLRKYLTFLLAWLCTVIGSLLVAIPLLGYVFEYFEFDIPNYIVPLLVFSVCIWLLQRNICLGSGFQGWAIFPRDIIAPFGTIAFVLMSQDVTVVSILCVFSLVSIFTCLAVLIAVVVKLGDDMSTIIQLPTLSLIKSWVLSARAFLISGMLQLGMNGWDILILGMYVGLEETGQYALAIKLASVVLIIVRLANTFLGNKFAHLNARGLHEKNYQLFIKICKMSALGALFMVVFLLFTIQYWSGAFGHEFDGVETLFLVLVVVNAIIAGLGPSLVFLNMTGLEQAASKQVALWSIVSVACNFALIPFIGVQGAVISYVLSNFGLRLTLFTVLKNSKN